MQRQSAICGPVKINDLRRFTSQAWDVLIYSTKFIDITQVTDILQKYIHYSMCAVQVQVNADTTPHPLSKVAKLCL